MTMTAEKKKMSGIRILRIEVWKFKDLDARSRWKKHSDECQEMSNLFYQTWLLWHVQNGTANKIREYNSIVKEWHEQKAAAKSAGDKFTLKKPKYDGPQCFSKELDALIWSTLTSAYPHVHSRTATLLVAHIKGTLSSRKDTTGTISGWWSILLNREGMPSFTRGVPIPFDKQNTKLIPPETDKDNWRVRLRISRMDLPEGKQVCPSVEDFFEIGTKKRKTRSIDATLWKIKNDECDFCGSSLQYDRTKNKWFILLAVRYPIEKAKVDLGKTAVLSARRTRPWTLRHDGRRKWLGSRGNAVKSVRSRLIAERRSRQEGYQWSGSSVKGHGRKRACQPWWNLSRVWSDFVKRHNHEVTSAAVKYCVENGIGRLVYRQPEGRFKGRRFLDWAGKRGDVRESSGWDWFQVKSMLSYKCAKVGIHFESEKSGVKKAAKKKAA